MSFLLISGAGLFTFVSTSLKVPSEHKYTVKTGDRKNGVAVHAWDEQHTVDWEGAKILEHEQNHWKRRTLEAIWIKKTEGRNSNLDCGLMLNQTWLSYIH